MPASTVIDRLKPAADASAPLKRRWRRPGPRSAAALAVAAALLACAPCLKGPFFLADDSQYVADNVALRQIPLSHVWTFFTTRTNPWEYLPVRDLSYRLDLALFGLNPTAFRIHNLILFALSCLAVWHCTLAFQRILRLPPDANATADASRPQWLAAVVTAFFAAHPAHVESVAWVAGRKDVLSGLWALVSLWLFTRALSAKRRQNWFLLAAHTSFTLAVLSKSSVVSLPLVAFLLAWAHFARKGRGWRAAARAARLTLPMLGLAGASVALQVFVSATYDPATLAAAGIHTLADRLGLTFRILGVLARIAVAPIHMRLIYDVLNPGPAGTFAVAAGALACASVLRGAWLTVRQRSLAWFGIAMAGVFALPFLQIIPFTTWSFASERFLYLPVLGVAIAAGAGLTRAPARLNAALAATMFLATLGVTTQRSVQWASQRELVLSNASLSPDEPISVKLAVHSVLLKEHRFVDARRAVARIRTPADRAFLLQYVEASEAFSHGDFEAVRRACPALLQAAPATDRPLRVELANMALEAGLLPEAETAYRDLLRAYPNFGEVHYNLGLTLARLGRQAEAAREMSQAITCGYVSAMVWNNLGLACKNASMPLKAETAFRRALDTDPNHWFAAYNLAQLLLSRGDREAARATLMRGLRHAAAAGEPAPQLEALLRNLDAAPIR